MFVCTTENTVTGGEALGKYNNDGRGAAWEK